MFLNATQADRATAATDRQVSSGLQYSGPFGSDNDKVGFAVGATHPNDRAADYQRLYNQLHAEDPGPVLNRNEYVAELVYARRPLPGLTLRPNLQYVVHPGGSSRNRDALVIGLKSSIVF